jgi:hypothetical protein
MLVIENLLLAVAIVGVAYAWSRAGFRPPRILPLPVRVIDRLVVTVGWTLVIGRTARSLATLLGDNQRVGITQSGSYAYLSRDPLRFWGEIVGDMIMLGGTGAALIFLGRRARHHGA